MAKSSKQTNNANANQMPMGYNPMGFGMPLANNQNTKGKQKSKGRMKKDAQSRAIRIERAKTLRSRQNYALQNIEYRKKLEDVQGKGVLDSSHYRLPEDKKAKKSKDFFYIMRKSVCFIMFLVLLISVAFYALSYLKLSAIPQEYAALFITRDASSTATDDNEAEVDADADEEEEEAEESQFTITTVSLFDPVFGFIKYLGNKINKNIDLGDSTYYDSLIAKVDVGMADNIAEYIILAYPVAIILYFIVALFMMFKAFFGIFGRRIYKKFGLGSIIMILCGGIVALAGLTFNMTLDAKMSYASVVDILKGALGSELGFFGGYGLLIMLVVPIIVLIMSMFAKKKIPYSIFDNISV